MVQLAAALQDTTIGTLTFNPDVAENLSYLDNLQSETADEAQAPTFLQPGVPATAPGACLIKELELNLRLPGTNRLTR